MARVMYLVHLHWPMMSMHSLCPFTFAASYLDLLFTRDENKNVTTKRYGNGDAFGFHIVNFLFMSNNIPFALAYGVYAFSGNLSPRSKAKCL